MTMGKRKSEGAPDRGAPAAGKSAAQKAKSGGKKTARKKGGSGKAKPTTQKPAAKKPAAKKPAAKKPTAKKTTAKKRVAKRAAGKKPAAKRTASRKARTGNATGKEPVTTPHETHDTAPEAVVAAEPTPVAPPALPTLERDETVAAAAEPGAPAPAEAEAATRPGLEEPAEVPPPQAEERVPISATRTRHVPVGAAGSQTASRFGDAGRPPIDEAVGPADGGSFAPGLGEFALPLERIFGGDQPDEQDGDPSAEALAGLMSSGPVPAAGESRSLQRLQIDWSEEEPGADVLEESRPGLLVRTWHRLLRAWLGDTAGARR